MGSYGAALIVLLVFSPLPSWANPLETELSPAEQREIDQRIESFYRRRFDPKVMDHLQPKFGITSGRFVRPNQNLRLDTVGPSFWEDSKAVPRDPLIRNAQAKATKRFKDYQCRKFWKKFPGKACDLPHTWAAIEPGDEVETLAESWIARSEIVRSLDEIPGKAKVKHPFWSADYWKMRWGLTAYRYAEGVPYKTYTEAINAYRQPEEWNGIAATLSPAKLAEAILGWSPAEKYDLTIGAGSFPLANEQKNEGKEFVGENGKVEDWYGLCHGWAPAAVFTPLAQKPVVATGLNGLKVTWYPEEIRAMVSLAWSNGDYWSNQAGDRCDEEKPKRYPNGRLSQQECFDTNPATLHLSLGNLIGKLGQSFLMDAAFDAEVWNQPILSYQFLYFNPRHPKQRSPDWKKVAVDYDAAFKAVDRFQKPMTRGKRDGGRYDDTGIKKIVGVIATVDYLTESPARPWPTEHENETVRVSYIYDLELHEIDGKLIPEGGEWHAKTHPDFLWMPHRGSVPTLSHDATPMGFSLDTSPSEALTTAASAAAGREGYPLCEIVSKLLAGASAERPYLCR